MTNASTASARRSESPSPIPAPSSRPGPASSVAAAARPWARLGGSETLLTDAHRRFGAKAARLARLIAAGLASPAGIALDSSWCAAQRRRLAAGEGLEAEEMAALRAEAAALVGEHAPHFVIRQSPKDPVTNLGGSEPTGLDGLAERLAETLPLWESRKARRRRAAADAEDHCALFLHLVVPQALRLKSVRLHDPENGEEAAMAKIERRTGDEAQTEAPEGPPEAAIAMAARAETVLGEPLELDMALDPDGAPLILGVRSLRQGGRARLRTAMRLEQSGRFDRDSALLIVEPESLEELLHPTIEPGFARDPVASGVPASPGAAAGRLCLTAEEAQDCKRAGDPAILARFETSPEDVHGMDAAAGVLTIRGGLTSHAAVVARGLGLPCVVGAADARLDLDQGALISADGRSFHRGVWITIDGSSGEVIAGKAPTRRSPPTGDLARLMSWADARRRLRVRANADTPNDLANAVRLGVDGVGLCRTEHMFFDPERINAMREMILADGEPERRAALERLLPMQRADFIKIFEIMDGAQGADGAAAPVTIRLLDPPLHEFLPQDPEGLAVLAKAMGRPADVVAARAKDLQEFNPMLGKRGCRLGVAFPEIYEMQARAIFEAALEAEQRTGRAPRPEIMIPLVSAVSELQVLKERIAEVAAAVGEERGARLVFGVGIMVETPRAALLAGQLGPLSTFFSFGTNDLTQMTYGLSRDDAGRLMRDYVEREVFEADPFQTLDREGVGELIRIGVERGRAAHPALEIGLCGEHGGSPATIAFCDEAGFDYVSCSPYRAPIARLAAAQAAIRGERAMEESPAS